MGAVLLTVGGLFGAAHAYLNSKDFQEHLLAEFSREIGCDVHVGRLRVRPLRGMDLVDIQVNRADIQPSDFLKTERLRLRYDLAEALFHQQIVLEELILSSPRIQLDLSAASSPSAPRPPAVPSPKRASADTEPVASAEAPPSEAVHALPPSPPAPPEAPTNPPAKTTSPWPGPPSMDLRRFVVEDAACSVLLPDQLKLEFHDAQLIASFSTDPVPTGSGLMNVTMMEIPGGIPLSNAKVHFLWRADSVAAPSFSAQVCGGVLEGKYKAEVAKGEAPFELIVVLKDLNLQQLLKAANLPSGYVKGKLNVQTRFQGSVRNPAEANGLGVVKVREARLENVPGLAQLGGFLNRADFYDLPLQKCEADFLLQQQRLEITRIEAMATDLELTGVGWINLREKTQEFQMKLSFGPALVETFPKKMFEGMNRRADGYVEMPFRWWGSLAHPQNDLLSKFAAIQMQAIGGSIFDRIFQIVPKGAK